MFNRVSTKDGQGERESVYFLGLGWLWRVFKETVVPGSRGHFIVLRPPCRSRSCDRGSGRVVPHIVAC